MREPTHHARLRRPGGWLRPVAVLSSAVIVATWLLAQIGVTAAIDAVARREFYALRGARAGGASVLFIAIDNTTAREWGPPPWPWTRFQALIDPILAGGPRLIAVLEPGPRVVSDLVIPPDLASAVRDGRLVLPPADPGFRQPKVVLDNRGVVEAIDLGDPATVTGISITSDVIARLGLAGAADRRGHLAVNFIGPVDTLPTLLAHQVARGDVPATTFAGRIAVIGLAGEQFTNLVPTPVGPMAPAEVHAHALHALVEHASWRDPGLTIAGLLVVGFAVLGIVGPRRARLAAVWIAAGCSLIVFGGYAAFAWFDLALAPGAPLVALMLGTASGLLLERHEAQRGAIELRDQVARRSRLTRTAQPGVTATVIHDRFAETLGTYIDLESCAWAELPSGGWHLEVRHWYGCADEQVVERRRDIRRDPWRSPYGSHRPEWADLPFMSEALGQKTLLLPLAAFGRLFGFWIVNVRGDVKIDDRQIRLLESLGDDVALALEEHRQQDRNALEPNHGGHLPSTLVDAVQSIRHEALRMDLLHSRARAALDRLPVGVLIATTWGYVEHCNLAMDRFLTAVGVDTPEQLGVAVLLAKVTRLDEATVRDVLRELATTGNALQLETKLDAPGAPPQIFELTLTRAQLSEGIADEHGPSSLVLTATGRNDRPLNSLDWRWSGLGAGARNVVDVGQLVQQTLVELAEAGAWPVAPVVALRAVSSVAVVRGHQLAEAIRALARLESAPSTGEVQKPRVGVEDSGHELTIRIDHPRASLPTSDVTTLLSSSVDDAPAHLAALVRARLQIEANRGQIEIMSDIEHGTSIAIRLPKPGGE